MGERNKKKIVLILVIVLVAFVVAGVAIAIGQAMKQRKEADTRSTTVASTDETTVWNTEEASTGKIETSDTTDTSETIEDAASILPGVVSVSGTDFVVDGKVLYLNGANTPWDNWNDIGGNFDAKFWDEHFQTLQDNGINATRIWISCNGDVGFDIDENGFVTSVSDAYWEDLETLLTLADQHGIYVMATIMSFDHFKDTYKTYPSWRKMVKSEAAMDCYIDTFVIPLCEKFDHHDSLFSIDLCNEPDWIIENQECGKLKWNDIGNLFAKEAAAIHEHSDILVTIGFGMAKYNSKKYQGNYGSDEFLYGRYKNSNAYLDYYSPHFYEWEAPWFNFPFDKSPVDFGMDGTKPCVIGEFSATGMTSNTKGSKDMDGSECYIGLYENGWNGGFAWTSNGVDSCGNLNDFAEGANEVAKYGLLR